MFADQEDREPSIDTIRLEEVNRLFGQEIVDRLLEDGRYRRDENGDVYWLSDEFAERLEPVTRHSHVEEPGVK